MSTLKATNLSHASAASPNIVLDSAGKVTFGGAVAGAGMDLITPTSVAGTGVTLSGGQVSFTTAPTISVNGCFSATYDTYRVVINSLDSTAAAAILLRLRVAGTDNTGANYSYQYILADNTAMYAGRSTAQTSTTIGSNASTRSLTIFDISAPFLATPTMFISNSLRTQATPVLFQYLGGQNQSISYDGFTIYGDGAGNFTGTLRIYGYRNS